MDADWRLQGQERYLTGKQFRWTVWSTPDPAWDHDHCEFCWAKFSDRPAVEHGDDGHEHHVAGWMTEDRWVCPTCFDDFRERFSWTVPDAPVEG